MFESPFETNKTKEITIPESAQVVFVADMFVEDYVGGAELTSQALIDSAPFEVFCVKSGDVTIDVLQSGHEKYWLFGNISNLDKNLVPSIVANLDYSILEYDYKYCKWRSPQKHESIEGNPCDCKDDLHGKMVSAFFYGAKSLWWMSEGQMDHYHSIFPFLEERENVVLSSVFDDQFFVAVKILREKYKNHDRKGWLVLGSTSWIKGCDAAQKWCEQNKKDFEIVWGLPYDEILEKMAQAEGFVYLPPGWDTCPRMVIEAKLLGCELVLNENVQHKDEIWFETDDPFDTEAYLYAARERFWSSIKSTMEWIPSLSGYTTVLDANKHQYPWRQSIESLLGFCHEVVVVDGGSTDGTWDELQEWSKKEERLNVYQVERDWSHPRFAVFDGLQKAEARDRCTGDYCWQQDADEIVHENDYKKIHQLIKNFPSQVDIVSLPVIEFWGGPKKVRLDVTPWKWRLTKNNPNITHGIPKQLRNTDDSGEIYASPGTDGCDYIHKETYEIFPHAGYYTQEADIVRNKALNGDESALENYQMWVESVISALPCVYHYSWYDLERKIKTYKNYWSKHWQSLYNIEQKDTKENNMFFDKPWGEVSDKDITNLSVRLSKEMGGWVFHEKIDFSRPTPHLSLVTSHPKVMEDSIDE